MPAGLVQLTTGRGGGGGQLGSATGIDTAGVDATGGADATVGQGGVTTSVIAGGATGQLAPKLIFSPVGQAQSSLPSAVMTCLFCAVLARALSA